MKRAIERYEKKAKHASSRSSSAIANGTALLSPLQALPDKGKSVDKWKNKDSAWRSVADGIEKVATELRKRKK
jgi:hypothetical protein